MPDTTGALATYIADFTLTEADTGGHTTIAGLDFPGIVFQGVAIEISGLGVGSAARFYNPVITDTASRGRCTNRTVPVWQEPVPRIKSTAPDNSCDIVDGVELTCSCGLPYGGESCSCPAYISKFGKQVCGGYGNQGVAVANPADPTDILTTHTDTTGEPGCYFYDRDGVTHSDCNSVDLGVASYTLLVGEGAPWDWPSLYISAEPEGGGSVFSILNNFLADDLLEIEVDAFCEADAAFLPWIVTGNEANTFSETYAFVPPVFMGLENVGADWVWENSGGLLLSDGPGTDLGAALDCTDTANAIACQGVNFNNHLYGLYGTLSNGVVTTTSTAAGPTTLEWAANGPARVTVFVWFDVAGALDTGVCTLATSEVAYDTWSCDTPARSIIFDTGAAYEVQVFAEDDPVRVSAYPYVL